MLTAMRLYGRTRWTDGRTTPGSVMPSLREERSRTKLLNLDPCQKKATLHGLMLEVLRPNSISFMCIGAGRIEIST